MTEEHSQRLHQRGEDGYPIRADDIMKQAYGPIPEAIEFQHLGGRGTPEQIHGWQWSSDFGRWSALVTFADGWHGFTYPVHHRDRVIPEDQQKQRIAWAGAAVETFMTRSGCDDEEVLGDLLTDLMHWADRNNYDFEAALSRAETHYEVETAKGKDSRSFAKLVDSEDHSTSSRGR